MLLFVGPGQAQRLAGAGMCPPTRHAAGVAHARRLRWSRRRRTPRFPRWPRGPRRRCGYVRGARPDRRRAPVAGPVRRRSWSRLAAPSVHGRRADEARGEFACRARRPSGVSCCSIWPPRSAGRPCSWPPIMRSVVDLPQPDGPSSTVKLPAGTVNSRREWRRRRCIALYCLVGLSRTMDDMLSRRSIGSLRVECIVAADEILFIVRRKHDGVYGSPVFVIRMRPQAKG